MSKHTPGPWEVVDNGAPNLRINGNLPKTGTHFSDSDHYDSIALVIQRDPHPRYGGGVDSETTLANARLMAAAPDLLRELCLALPIINAYGDQRQSAQIMAVINSATGGEA